MDGCTSTKKPIQHKKEPGGSTARTLLNPKPDWIKRKTHRAPGKERRARKGPSTIKMLGASSMRRKNSGENMEDSQPTSTTTGGENREPTTDVNRHKLLYL